jgi:hypothetical protein
VYATADANADTGDGKGDNDDTAAAAFRCSQRDLPCRSSNCF